MKSKTKIIATILATCFIISSASGCASNDSKTTSSEAKPATTETAKETPKTEEKATEQAATEETEDNKTYDIKWLSFYGPETNDTYPQTYLEEKYNVKLTNMIIDRNTWNDQLNVKLASGDIPDVFWCWGTADVANYAAQGILAVVPRELIEEKMPVYTKSIQDIEPRLWYNSSIGDINYGLPLYWASGAVPQSPVYNKKWLENLGLTVPKTLDEYINVLTKFAKEDPDKNGANDTYGISFRGKDAPNQVMFNVFWAHGVPLFGYAPSDDDDSVLTPTFNTKAWKDAMTIVAKLYKDGVIDPESITDDNAQLTQKFANQKTGVLENGNWYHWLPVIGGYRIAADNAGVELEFGHLPVQDGYYRKSSVISGGVNNSIVAMGIQVEKDPGKMNRILEILEGTATVDEDYLATAFGKEGDTYTMVNGTPERDPKVGDAIQMGTKYGIGTFFNLFTGTKSTPMTHYDYTADQLKLRETFLQDTTIQMPFYIGALDSSGEYPDLVKMETEYIIKFATGELNLEGDLDAYIQKFLQSGGEVLSKEATDLYKTQNNK